MNLAAFYNDFKDIQLTVNRCPTGNPLTETPCAARLNAGDAKVKGFELELAAEPIDGLAIDGSLSYIDFKYDEDSLNPGAAAPPFGTNAGGVLPNDPPFVPPWKATFGIQYKADLGSAGAITPRLDVLYQDDQFTGAYNRPVPNPTPPPATTTVRELTFIPSYTVLNGRITWQNEDEDLQIALEVTNITDKYYFLSTFDGRGAGAGFLVGQPARPREWAVSVRKRF